MAARDKQNEGDAAGIDAETEARIAELQAQLDRAARGLSEGSSDEGESESKTSDKPAVGREGDGSPADRAVAPIDHEPSEEEGAEGDDEHAAGTLGAARYVMAGFFLTCIAAAYVLGRVLATVWGKLAEAIWFQRSLTALARVGEEERSELTMVIGATVALGLGVYTYRRPDVREWTDEVASELAKVTWPDKSEVTNSTIIVIVTSTFATVYLALLDRFWGFVTNLVYGS